MRIAKTWAIPLLTCAALAASARGDEMASATIDPSSLGGGVFQYDITLDDIGTAPIGTFWFSWIPGEDFMPVMPTDIKSPAGWSDIVTHSGPSDGYAIQWKASGPSDAVQPGNSLSGYEFQSTATPAELAAANVFYPGKLPVVTSFVYSGGPFSDAGFRFTPSMSAVPEPSMMFGTAVLFAALLIFRYRRRRTA